MSGMLQKLKWLETPCIVNLKSVHTHQWVIVNQCRQRTPSASLCTSPLGGMRSRSLDTTFKAFVFLYLFPLLIKNMFAFQCWCVLLHGFLFKLHRHQCQLILRVVKDSCHLHSMSCGATIPFKVNVIRGSIELFGWYMHFNHLLFSLHYCKFHCFQVQLSSMHIGHGIGPSCCLTWCSRMTIFQTP